jgi:hypothetical protein
MRARSAGKTNAFAREWIPNVSSFGTKSQFELYKFLVVLDEVQRRAKRGLIERNRCRRIGENRLIRVRRGLLKAFGGPHEKETEQQQIRLLASHCARTFWEVFDGKEEGKGIEGWAMDLQVRVIKFARTLMAPMEVGFLGGITVCQGKK